MTDRIKKASEERRQLERQALHSLILRSASDLFREHGYDGFTMRQLAEQIGYTATTIYNYFHNKDELLFAIIDEAFQVFQQDLQAAVASTDDPFQQLNRLGKAYVKFGLDNPLPYRVMFIEKPGFLLSSRGQKGPPRIAGLQIMRQTIERAKAAGLIIAGDTDAQVDALWATAHGIITLAITFPAFDRQRADKAADLILESMTESLRKKEI